MKTDNIICSKCGRKVEVTAGALTERQKKRFVCEPCREDVIENQVEKINRPSSKLLLD